MGKERIAPHNSEKDRSITEIRASYNSWRAFHCTPENAAVFERQAEQTHRDIGVLLRHFDEPLFTERCEVDLTGKHQIDPPYCKACGLEAYGRGVAPLLEVQKLINETQETLRRHMELSSSVPEHDRKAATRDS
jgi:hypothetical protein